MLPTKGHFATVLCPFNEEGNCNRAACHYLHRGMKVLKNQPVPAEMPIREPATYSTNKGGSSSNPYGPYISSDEEGEEDKDRNANKLFCFDEEICITVGSAGSCLPFETPRREENIVNPFENTAEANEESASGSVDQPETSPEWHSSGKTPEDLLKFDPKLMATNSTQELVAQFLAQEAQLKKLKDLEKAAAAKDKMNSVAKVTKSDLPPPKMVKQVPSRNSTAPILKEEKHPRRMPLPTSKVRRPLKRKAEETPENEVPAKIPQRKAEETPGNEMPAKIPQRKAEETLQNEMPAKIPQEDRLKPEEKIATNSPERTKNANQSENDLRESSGESVVEVPEKKTVSQKKKSSKDVEKTEKTKKKKGPRMSSIEEKEFKFIRHTLEDHPSLIHQTFKFVEELNKQRRARKNAENEEKKKTDGVPSTNGAPLERRPWLLPRKTSTETSDDSESAVPVTRIRPVSNVSMLLRRPVQLKPTLAPAVAEKKASVPSPVAVLEDTYATAGKKKRIAKTRSPNYVQPTRLKGYTHLLDAFLFMNTFPCSEQAMATAEKEESKIYEECGGTNKNYEKRIFATGKRIRINTYLLNAKKEKSEGEAYEKLLLKVHSEEDLTENGFIMQVGNRFQCSFESNFHFNSKWKEIRQAIQNGNRFCIRCKQVYQIDPETELQLYVGCTFHPKPARTDKRTGVRLYGCGCTISSNGCTTEEHHLTESSFYDNIEDVLVTSNDYPCGQKIYALDCEMVHTIIGMELAHVVVVNYHGDTVYESLVKPAGYIIDYFTEFSGMTEEIMMNAKKSRYDVQDELAKIIGADCILIGHSLDSDLRALRIHHKNIIDTSILFGTYEVDGIRRKKSLQNLAGQVIMRNIQNEEAGHSAKEDALAALDLVKNKYGLQ